MDFSPAIQLIEKSKHIGLVLPQAPNHDVLVSAEVLVHLLLLRSIYIGIITPFQGPYAARGFLPLVRYQRDTSFSALASLAPLTREFIISLDTSAAPISQLRYENESKRVNIILSPSSSAPLQDNLSFREGRMQCDCIITLGVREIEEIDMAKLDIDPSLFSETPIITMDISSSHKQYGEINLIDASLPSLAELMYRFLAAVPDHKISSESATLLLSGILNRTDGFTVLTNANTLLSSHELIQSGADFEAAHALSRTQAPVSLMSLIGRALARSKMDNEKNIVWSSLTRDDFLATNRTPADARDVLSRIEKEFPGQSAYVLLWQDPITQKIHARITSNAMLLHALQDKTDAELEHAHAQMAETYYSFPDAEKSIGALLASAL